MDNDDRSVWQARLYFRAYVAVAVALLVTLGTSLYELGRNNGQVNDHLEQISVQLGTLEQFGSPGQREHLAQMGAVENQLAAGIADVNKRIDDAERRGGAADDRLQAQINRLTDIVTQYVQQTQQLERQSRAQYDSSPPH